MPSSKSGSFRLREQVGGWAVYADVSLTIIDRDSGTALVSINENVRLDDYEYEFAAINFGVSYVIGCVPNSNSLGVVVNKVYTHPVDTTPMAIAYATCHAVLNCLDNTPAKVPYFDRETLSFVFPGRGPVN